MSVTVDKRGPLFDGRAEKAVADCCDEIEQKVATIGASMIRTRMNDVFKKQTPFYRFKNVAAKEAPGWKIWDQEVIYGYWLEGIGSRNKTTRFKGYRTYRFMVGKIEARASVIAQGVVVTYMGRMG